MALGRKETAIRIALVVMGVLTMQPVVALFDPGQLAAYGVSDPDLATLRVLQHRGLLQFALGAALVYAALRPDVRVAVALCAIVTKAGGVLLSFAQPDALADGIRIAMVFDPLCIVLLAAILFDIGRGWRRRESRTAA